MAKNGRAAGMTQAYIKTTFSEYGHAAYQIKRNEAYPWGAFCITFDLQQASIHLENQFMWPLKTGFTVFEYSFIPKLNVPDAFTD